MNPHRNSPQIYDDENDPERTVVLTYTPKEIQLAKLDAQIAYRNLRAEEDIQTQSPALPQHVAPASNSEGNILPFSGLPDVDPPLGAADTSDPSPQLEITSKNEAECDTKYSPDNSDTIPSPEVAVEPVEPLIRIDPFAAALIAKEKELHGWILSNKLADNMFDILKEEKIVDIDRLAAVDQVVFDRICSHLKPIPGKKFRTAHQELKTTLGLTVANAPVQPATPIKLKSPTPEDLPTTPTIALDEEHLHQLHQQQYHQQQINEYVHPPKSPEPSKGPEIPSEPVPVENDSYGETVLINTETSLSLAELRSQLEKENELIEHLITLTVNNASHYSQKAMEILHQSKLDHQARAKRLKKLIQQKKNMNPTVPAVPVSNPPNLIENAAPSLPDGEEVKGSPSEKKSVEIKKEVINFMMQPSYRKTNELMNLERLKIPQVAPIKPSSTTADDDRKVLEEAAAAAQMEQMRQREAERIRELEQLKQMNEMTAATTWKCTVCSRLNYEKLVQCPDCFTFRHPPSPPKKQAPPQKTIIIPPGYVLIVRRDANGNQFPMLVPQQDSIPAPVASSPIGGVIMNGNCRQCNQKINLQEGDLCHQCYEEYVSSGKINEIPQEQELEVDFYRCEDCFTQYKTSTSPMKCLQCQGTRFGVNYKKKKSWFKKLIPNIMGTGGSSTPATTPLVITDQNQNYYHQQIQQQQQQAAAASSLPPPQATSHAVPPPPATNPHYTSDDDIRSQYYQQYYYH